ncbi:tetratricopeptide repeat protein [Pontibacter sp. BT731]|uniref:tetratricopeptide repeat protein n=1 Tax=Pontibacter coccineus TaxID=3063328 RepID=UPI0026E1DBC8|nr:tetratricopeptide repeat protein [Pontibacter sp. BT731]MDO6392188.1 tetratricopeptide repeat protein [Pontibacter sp. BT731]
MMSRWALSWIVAVLMLSGCGKEEGTREQMVDLATVAVEDPAKQLVSLSEAIERSKRDGSLYARRAMVLLRQDELDKALSDVNEAIRLSKEPANFFVKAQVLYLMGRREEALPLALQAERNSFESSSLYVLLTELYLDRGEYTKAARFAKQALELSPDDPHAVYYKGRVSEVTGDTTVAIRLYQQALEFKPDFAETHRSLAGLYLAQQDLAQARKHTEHGLRLKPEDPQLWHYKGMLQMQSARKDSALVSFEKALAISDTMQAAHFQLAQLRQGLGENELVLQHLEKAPRYSKELKYLSVRASSLERLGENLAALRTYERMLAMEPKHTYARQSVARLRYRLERPRPQLDSMAIRQRGF